MLQARGEEQRMSCTGIMHDTTGSAHTSANLVLIIYYRNQCLKSKKAQPSEQNSNTIETAGRHKAERCATLRASFGPAGRLKPTTKSEG